MLLGMFPSEDSESAGQKVHVLASCLVIPVEVRKIHQVGQQWVPEKFSPQTSCLFGALVKSMPVATFHSEFFLFQAP